MRRTGAGSVADAAIWNLSDDLFDEFRSLIYREAGIALTDGKKQLFVSRMTGRLRELKLLLDQCSGLT